MIKVEIAKAVPEATSVKLKTVLHVAEREMGKGESDESVVALADARRAQK